MTGMECLTPVKGKYLVHLKKQRGLSQGEHLPQRLDMLHPTSPQHLQTPWTKLFI